MATVNPRVVGLRHGVYEITWPNMANGDVGATAPDGLPGYPVKTVTVRGTFGSGGSVTLKGTDAQDPAAATSWDTLHDIRGGANNLTFTSRGTQWVLENPARLAPHVTAGDGTTSLTVVVCCAAGVH